MQSIGDVMLGLFLESLKLFKGDNPIQLPKELVSHEQRVWLLEYIQTQLWEDENCEGFVELTYYPDLSGDIKACQYFNKDIGEYQDRVLMQFY